MTFRRRHLLAIVALVAAVSAWPGAAEKRSVTETDLFDFVWVADPQISPDGARVVFVQVKADRKKDQYDTALWLAVADGAEPPRRLTAGTRDSSPRWSPDGGRLAFVRSVEKDGRAQPPQIHVMDMAGGEPRAVTEIPRGAGSPEWAPDGRTIAFSSTATPEDLEKAKKKDAGADAKGDEAKTADSPRESDVRVITEAVYRANGIPGSGYVDPDRPAHIWTVQVPDGGEGPQAPRRITSGEFPATNHRWSRDGSQLYFVADRRKEEYYFPNDSDLYSVSRDGGEPRVVASIDGSIGQYAPSPDGRRIAFVGTTARQSRPLVHAARLCSSWTVRAERRANLTGGLRLRHRRRPRRRPARAARRAPGQPGVDAGRPRDPDPRGRAGRREHQAHRRRHGQDGSGYDGTARGDVLHLGPGRAPGGDGPLRRRRWSATCTCSMPPRGLRRS